jgi:hypothetical protein
MLTMKYYRLPYFEALNIIQVVGFARTNNIAPHDFIQIKFESDTEIEQKRTLFKGRIV